MADLKLGNMTLMGNVKVPPSKSMAHRLLIGAGLAKGKSTIEGISSSEDMKATLDCLSATGANIYLLTLGNAGRLNSRYPNAVRVAESGNSLRFYCAAANGAGFNLFALTLTVGSKNGFPFAGVMVMGGNLNRLAE